MGRTIIESMLVKTPVLASDSGAHPELIKDNINGFLFPIGSSSSPEYMAHKFNTILSMSDDRLSEITDKAFDFAQSKFSVKLMHMLYLISTNLFLDDID